MINMEYKYLKNLRFLMLVAVAYGISMIVIYWIINNALLRSMEQQAVTVAEIVAIQATSARSVYSREIVQKLSKDGFGPSVHSDDMKGYVPIPAQFLKKVGIEASKNTAELFYYRPVSKWNLEPTQGLTNDFLRWAWEKLEAQDQLEPKGAIDWKPVWRVEVNEQGERLMRYLKADPAVAESCATCHNQYEKTQLVIDQRIESGVEPGKQWKQHQLLGALYINIPLKKVELIASDQNKQTVLLVAAISLFAILLTGLVLARLFKQGQSLSQLSYQASHDTLTGLVNRRGFERYIDRLYDENQFEKDQINHVLILMDLDGFKLVNDTYGHQAGDELLVVIAKTLGEIVRSNDIVARLGGDEFAIILNDCPYDKAKQIASDILQKVGKSSISAGNKLVGVGVSIGMGCLSGDESVMDETIDAIDSACYEAKKNGKNKIFYLENGGAREFSVSVVTGLYD